MKEKLQELGKKVKTLIKEKPGIITFLSYILVAAAASMVTMALMMPQVASPYAPGQNKLMALEQLINDRYIGEVDWGKVEDAAANAMIGSLGDRWSFYVPKSEMESYEEQKNNSYVGIGVTIMQAQDVPGLQVTQVTPGGSAEEAGILPGDVIVGVAGQSIADMSIEAVSALIKGEEGTQVELTVMRDGTEMKITVTRRQIKTPVAVATLLENNIGLIQIKNFNTNCAKETIAAIMKLQEQGAEKLIFDVRFNGGGYAHEMVTLLDYLLPEGDLFKTVDYTGKEAVEKSDASCLNIPMAVLVNGDSYSAAEFFAAALDEYDAAVVVGEQTSGKGYFQVTFSLPDGSAVALSIGKYFTPQGKSLEGVGITPELVIPVDEKTAAGIYAGTIKPMEDPQILKAIEALTGK